LYGSGGIKKRYSSQSTLEFDLTAARKSWLHLFPDFFEGYNYLQTFPFGKKSNYPVKSITTNIYDINDGSVLDTWATTFSGYVFSQDGFILQTTAKGRPATRARPVIRHNKLDYQCTK
jgi:hypothetical protein